MPTPLMVATLAGLALAGLLGALSVTPQAEGLRSALALAHGPVALFGFLMPGLALLHWRVAGPRMPRPLQREKPLAALWMTAALLLGAAAFMEGIPATTVSAAAWLSALAAAVLQTATVMPALPKGAERGATYPADPLAKGDDASLHHVRFAHMVFLPVSVLGLGAASLLDMGPLRAAALHWLLAGYGLLSVYGLSHIVVPRLSGVPAIAAGAIKGELHSSLLGLVLLAAGLMIPNTALSIAGGGFLFLGAFTFMGVLGANIMKNKSPTQRVTPQFAYVPWTFAGVFWVVAGVLLGLFLVAARVRLADGPPEGFPHLWESLRFVHVHTVLLGGFALLLLGFATRLWPESRGQAPVPFSRSRWSFYGLNLGILLMVYGSVSEGPGAPGLLWGSWLTVLALAAWFMSLQGFAPRGGR